MQEEEDADGFVGNSKIQICLPLDLHFVDMHVYIDVL